MASGEDFPVKTNPLRDNAGLHGILKLGTCAWVVVSSYAGKPWFLMVIS